MLHGSQKSEGDPKCKFFTLNIYQGTFIFDILWCILKSWSVIYPQAVRRTDRREVGNTYLDDLICTLNFLSTEVHSSKNVILKNRFLHFFRSNSKNLFNQHMDMDKIFHLVHSFCFKIQISWPKKRVLPSILYIQYLFSVKNAIFY